MTCTCDPKMPMTYNPDCEEHGDGSLHGKAREAMLRGDWATYDALKMAQEKEPSCDSLDSFS